jgi:cobalt-zinc-cadmium efflux system outer membrane protein
MVLRSATWWLALLGPLWLAGCYYPVRAKIDSVVCDISKQPFDIHKLEAADQRPLMPSADEDSITQTAYTETETQQRPGPTVPPRYDPFKDLEKYHREPLRLPPDLLPEGTPGPLRLSLTDPAKRREQLRREFQPLPPPGLDYDGVPGPNGHPMTLAELQQLGMSSSPLIKQAVANVETARGNAFQAGLMPNPIMGFEVDTFGTTGGAGYVGGYMDQVFRTGGKLRLNRAIAAMDLRNAEVALRRAQMDLATRIRTFYFQLLVARENMRINRLLVAFIDAIYEIQAGQVRTVELTLAAYEPMYLRALANTARTNLIAARNSYIATWKQLAAAMGVPGMPMTQIAGRVDMPVPIFDFEKVKNRVLNNHTDVVTAHNLLQQARFSLLLAQVTPYPDVDVRFLIQKDYTGPPNEIAPSLAVSVPVPIFNRNQGGIAAAQAQVVYYGEEPLRVRTDLYGRMTDAFNRYRTFHENLLLYRDKILPDLVRVYNSIYQRYQVEGPTNLPGPAAGVGPAIQITPPTINDVVVAQQILTTSVASYIVNLGGMWQAVVDVTDLIQTNDMFRMGQERLPTEPVPVLPDLEQLKPLLQTHPCSPLPDPALRGGDGTWPPAIPTRDNYRMPTADDEARKPQASRPAVAMNPTAAPASPPVAPTPAAAPQLPDMLPEIRPAARKTESQQSPAPSRVDPQLLEPPPPVPRRSQ